MIKERSDNRFLCHQDIHNDIAARAVATEREKINTGVDEIISMSENLLDHLENNDISYLNIKKTVRWVKERAERLRSQSIDEQKREPPCDLCGQGALLCDTCQKNQKREGIK
jgi:hypothetical protein